MPWPGGRTAACLKERANSNLFREMASRDPPTAPLLDPAQGRSEKTLVALVHEACVNDASAHKVKRFVAQIRLDG